MSYLNDPRVLFAAERTLLAWNRTSLSLIAFGFVIERAGLLIQALGLEEIGSQGVVAFWLGISFISLGSISSAFSARQYAVILRSLNPEEFPPGYSAKWGLVINNIVAVLGISLATVLIIARIM
ncbi:MAG TPA: DUF202 domain-containing protein [Gammaproteobacteria bacterium]